MSGKPSCPYLEPSHEDAKLTQRGRLQATAIGTKLIHTKPLPEIVLVSPLFRTLQTATIAMSTISHVQVPMISEERIRERMGLHFCDKRSDKTKLVSYFGKVDFANIAPGPDAFFTDSRESEEETARRGKDFFLSLKDRPEACFALFTHSSLLFNTLSRALETPDPKGKLPQYLSQFVYFLHSFSHLGRCHLLTFHSLRVYIMQLRAALSLARSVVSC